MRPFLLVLLVIGVYADDYVDEVQGQCHVSMASYSCGKYKVFKYIDEYHMGNVSLTSDSSIKFVNIPSAMNNSAKHGQTLRQHLQDDSELVKMMKFFKRKVYKFVQEQGVAMELPEEVQVVSETSQDTVIGRKKKEKKMIILPLLILLKVFKIKWITSLILLGVIAIKKMLVVAAFILPGVVAAIKHHCKGAPVHVVPYHVDEDHYTHEHDHDFSSYGAVDHDDKHYWSKKKKDSFFF